MPGPLSPAGCPRADRPAVDVGFAENFGVCSPVAASAGADGVGLAVILPGRDDRRAGDEAGRKALDLDPHRAIEPVPAEHVDRHQGDVALHDVGRAGLDAQREILLGRRIFKR